jgi:hypothetical protein
MFFHLSILWHFQGFWEKKTAYCTERIVVHSNIPSALRLVKHDDFGPIRKPLHQWALHEEEPTSTSPEDEPGPSCTIVDPDFRELTVPNLISQSELKDLMRDLNMSKIQVEL